MFAVPSELRVCITMKGVRLSISADLENVYMVSTIIDGKMMKRRGEEKTKKITSFFYNLYSWKTRVFAAFGRLTPLLHIGLK